jgi:hypothetical protein
MLCGSVALHDIFVVTKMYIAINAGNMQHNMCYSFFWCRMDGSKDVFCMESEE